MVREHLQRLVGDDQYAQVCECRRCGTTVDPDDDACPYCGPTDIVDYDLS